MAAMSAPEVLTANPEHSMAALVWMALDCVLKPFTLAFSLELARLTSIIATRILMSVTTIRISTEVNPFDVFDITFCFSCVFSLYMINAKQQHPRNFEDVCLVCTLLIRQVSSQLEKSRQSGRESSRYRQWQQHTALLRWRLLLRMNRQKRRLLPMLQ